jgi:hypothetical protein
MPRHVGSIAILFGAPSRFAHDDDERDEDNLNRELPRGDGSDVAKEFVGQMLECLQRGGQPAIRAVRVAGQALEKMADAAQHRDGAALRNAAETAHAAFLDVDAQFGREGSED